jgi:anti-sigma regulatory factor (Ser/Thr protein kinase)
LTGKLRVLPRTDQHLIQNTPAAPAVARRYVGESLADVPRPVVDVVSLMVSELATNCVRHVQGDFLLTIEHTDREVRVDVADGGGGGVTMKNPEPGDPSGRGLRIVDQLSDDWGVEEFAGRQGKHVWFTLRLESAAAVSGSCR